MMVLGIIGFLLGAFLLYLFIIKVNEMTYRSYKYEFFNIGNFVITVIGYGALWVGNGWYESALKAGKDLLNGQILFGIGVMLIMYIFYINTARTNLFFGIFLTIIQLVIYAPLSVGVFFGLIILAAALAETKPVYVLNN